MCVPGIVLCCLSHGRHQSIPYRELWSAPLHSLHFPMQPNLSQWTKSCQIRADSYRSISSTQTCQLLCGGDYARGEGDSPISRLWGSLWQCLAYQTCSDVSLPMHQQWQQILGESYLYPMNFEVVHQQQPLLNLNTASNMQQQCDLFKSVYLKRIPKAFSHSVYLYDIKYSFNTICVDFKI